MVPLHSWDPLMDAQVLVFTQSSSHSLSVVHMWCHMSPCTLLALFRSQHLSFYSKSQGLSIQELTFKYWIVFGDSCISMWRSGSSSKYSHSCVTHHLGHHIHKMVRCIKLINLITDQIKETIMRQKLYCSSALGKTRTKEHTDSALPSSHCGLESLLILLEIQFSVSRD